MKEHFLKTAEDFETQAVELEAQAAELRRMANQVRAFASGESIAPTQKLLPAPSTDAQASPAKSSEGEAPSLSRGSKKKCLVPNCPNPPLTKEICGRHYQRFRKQRLIKKTLTVEGFAKAQLD
jgi:hypothetical protein